MQGSKVFCLQSASMQTIDVPQSAAMFRYLAQKDWGGAHRMACLGVTEADWRALALAALEARACACTDRCACAGCACSSAQGNPVFRSPVSRSLHPTHAPTPASHPQAMELDVARAAFIRVRDPRAVELVDRIAAGLKGGVPRPLLLGEALAWQGRFSEAARLWVGEGRLDKARARAAGAARCCARATHRPTPNTCYAPPPSHSSCPTPIRLGAGPEHVQRPPHV